MRINTNVSALSAHRNLSKTGVNLGKSIERLSSGLRINRAGDDAAGLVISEKLRAESSGLRQSVRNAQDGISFVQTAEGALDEVGGMLNRMRDLTVQYLNGTQDDDSKEAIQAEFDALGAEIARIGSSTEFAGAKIFNNDRDGGGTFVAASDTIDFQVGNGSSDQISVEGIALIHDGTTNSIGGEDLSAHFQDTNLGGASGNNISSTTLGDLDDAISGISTTRGSLGATQNRLESTVRNLSVTAENLSAAESRIRDVDVAEEMMSFTRSQILQQAGTSMLAQANGVSQSALSLLG